LRPSTYCSEILTAHRLSTACADRAADDPTTADVDESMTLEMGRGALEAAVDVDGVPVTS